MIEDYATLKSAISSICARKDVKFLGQFDDWLVEAENLIYNGYGDIPALKLQEMAKNIIIPAVDEKYSLPDDYMSMLRISNDKNHPLQWVPPQDFYTSQSGEAQFYTIVGNDIIVAPTSSADLNLTYWKKYPTLASGSPANDLLLKNPSVYLRAILIGAFAYTRNSEEEAKATSRYKGIIEALNGAAQEKRHSGNVRRVSYSGGFNGNLGQ